MSRRVIPNMDYMTKDYLAFKTMMLEKLSTLMPEYTDRSPSDAGMVIIDLLAHGLDILSYYTDSTARESILITAQQKRNVLKHCSIFGYIPTNSTSSEFKQVFKLAMLSEEAFTIPKGTVVKTIETSAESSVYFETQEDLIIPPMQWGNELDENSPFDYLYQVPVKEGISVNNEIVGSSNGASNQYFILKYSPVIFDDVVVEVDSGTGFKEWEKVDSFIDSSKTAKHYTLNIDEFDFAHINFGDNLFGLVPPSATNNIRCSYRIGGGENGNVSANKISVLETNLAGVKETFNPKEAEIKGTNAEDLDSIKHNAVAYIKTLWGAITLTDFEDITRINFQDVEDAYAVSSPENKFDVIVSILTKEGRYTPELTDEIAEMFDPQLGGRMILGSGTVTLKEAEYQNFKCDIFLFIRDYFKQAEVIANVKAYILDYFEQGKRMFEEEIFVNDLALEIEQRVEGVKAIKITCTIDGSYANLVAIEADKGNVFILEEADMSFTTSGGIAP